MWPDREQLVPLDAASPDPASDPALAALTGVLVRAGDRARRTRSDADRPDAAFASSLRDRLVGEGVPVPRAVGARVRGRGLAASPMRRWQFIALAAAVVIAVGAVARDGWVPAPPITRATDVASATLVRDGTSRHLQAGDALQVGDTVRVDVTGRATLEFGASQARLSGGAELGIAAITADGVVLRQAHGRVFHRVSGRDGSYDVRTLDLTWTAVGTAFDLDLIADSTGGGRVRFVGVEHDVRLTSPTFQGTVGQGRTAEVRSADARTDGTPDVVIAPMTPADLEDPWLLRNARRDAILGFPLGVFEGVELAIVASTPAAPTVAPSTPGQPVPSSTASPRVAPAPTTPGTATAKPTAPESPTPTPTPTTKPTATPTPKPTPKPTATPKPSATASPSPGLVSLDLTATGCDGGFVALAWSKSSDQRFHHYQTLRSPGSTIPATYPPDAPVEAPSPLYVVDRTTLAAIDPGLSPGTTVYYRTVAFDDGDAAYAASAVTSATPKGVRSLGALTVAVEGPKLRATWSPYGGPGACFTYYKIVWSASSTTPSYLGAHDGAWAVSEQAAAMALMDGLPPGDYWFRVEVIRSGAATGKVLVARTDVMPVTIP